MSRIVLTGIGIASALGLAACNLILDNEPWTPAPADAGEDVQTDHTAPPPPDAGDAGDAAPDGGDHTDATIDSPADAADASVDSPADSPADAPHEASPC